MQLDIVNTKAWANLWPTSHIRFNRDLLDWMCQGVSDQELTSLALGRDLLWQPGLS